MRNGWLTTYMYRAYVREKSEGVLDDNQLEEFETS